MKEDYSELSWCPAISSLQEVIGGKWKIEILFYIAFENATRFGQIRRCLGSISDSTLSKQLRELVEDGFLERVDYGEMPPRVEYHLTRRGHNFTPILQLMWDWAEREFDFSEAERQKMARYREGLNCSGPVGNGTESEADA